MYAGETERNDRKTAALKRRAAYTAKMRELDANQTKHTDTCDKKKLERKTDEIGLHSKLT